MKRIKRRIIINIIDDSISDLEAAEAVKQVIKSGKSSKIKNIPQYCFVTTFTGGSLEKLVVYANEKRYTTSDIFYVAREK